MGTYTFVVASVQSLQAFGTQQGPGDPQAATVITAQPQDPNIIEFGTNPGDPLQITVRGTVASTPGTTFTITIP